jgi:hypothetical protein
MTIVLLSVAAETLPVALYAQSLLHAPDSAVTTKSTTGLDLSGYSYSRAGGMNSTGIKNSSPDFLKNIGTYKLNFSNGLSLKTESSVNSLLNPNTLMNPSGSPSSLRRENILPHEELLYGQHFSFGASYNGLNNMLRGGYGGMNSRNPGLSLHAGISF